MTRDEIQKVRDWINGTSTHDEFCDVMTLDDEYRHLPCSCGLSEAIAILDRALAAPEQEPFCYVNVNAQGDVTRTIKREDKWCKTPLYRHPAPQSVQPVAVYEGENAMGFEVVTPLVPIRVGTELYAAPPSREWQGLTEDERATLLGMGEYMTLPMKWTFAHAIEAALRAKNSGEQNG